MFLALFIFNLSNISAVRPCRSCSREHTLHTKHANVDAVIKILRRLPESNEVIEQALRQGSISVEVSKGRMPFKAMWLNGPRKIVLERGASRQPGSLLSHLLFELMNALSEDQFLELCDLALDGQIDCDSYVEAVERIEYRNMIRADAIIEKGLSLGIFPPAPKWEIIDDFATHYKIQQLAGHSPLIAREYQEMRGRRHFSPYRGTVQNLKQMSRREKESQIESLYSRYVIEPG